MELQRQNTALDRSLTGLAARLNQVKAELEKTDIPQELIEYVSASFLEAVEPSLAEVRESMEESQRRSEQAIGELVAEIRSG